MDTSGPEHTPSPGRHDYLKSPSVTAWTERAVAELNGLRGRKELPVLHGKAALLALDLQRIFVDPESPAFVPAWSSADGPFRKLLDAARTASAPIVWSRHVHPEGDPGGTIRHFFGRLLTAADPLAAFGQGYGPAYGEHQVLKARHSVFTGTDLRGRLSDSGVEVVVIAGVRAPLCVMASAVEAASLGFLPVVAVDGIAAVREADHLATLRALSGGLAFAATVDEICARWAERADAVDDPSAEGRGKEEPDTPVLDMVVVGAGPAGIAAALQARRDGLSVVVISDEPPGGMVRAAGPMANVPGFEPGISGEAMAERLTRAIDGLDVLRRGRVTGLARRGGIFYAVFAGAEAPENPATVASKTVVLATGTEPAQFDMDGWDEIETSGRAHRDARTIAQSLEGKTVLVIGGGDAALDTALTARRRGARVVILIRGERPKAAAHLIRRAEAAEVELVTRATVVRFESAKDGPARAHYDTPDGRQEAAFDHAVVCVGRRPRDTLLRQLGGAVDLNRPDGTAPKGVFLAGDLVAGRDRFVHRAMGDGQRAACNAREFLKGRSLDHHRALTEGPGEVKP
jgi:thioredoxin reductase/nicotinamidase-related amidase